VKRHPIAATSAAAVGAAGLGYAIVQGVRKALNAVGSEDTTGDDDEGAGSSESDEAEDDDDEDEQSGSADARGEAADDADDAQEDDEDAGEEDEGDEDDEDDQGEEDEEDDPDAEASADDDAGEEDDEEDSEEEDDDDEDDESSLAQGVREGATALSRYGREGVSRLVSRIRDGTSGTREAAREGFRRGREFGSEESNAFPLVISGLALLGGAALALLLPPTRAEDKLLGKTADRWNGRIKDATSGLVDQGKELVTKAFTDAVDTAVREAEREGLTPDRLGRKVKRLAGHVRRAITDSAG